MRQLMKRLNWLYILEVQMKVKPIFSRWINEFHLGIFYSFEWAGQKSGWQLEIGLELGPYLAYLRFRTGFWVD